MGVQLNVASESGCDTCMSTTPGWAAHLKIGVTKEPALVQLLRVKILAGVGENSLEYMLVGKLIHNGDVVMFSYYEYGSKYVTIQEETSGADTNLNFCPGVTPPPYLSYGICSKNAFRIYRKP